MIKLYILEREPWGQGFERKDPAFTPRGKGGHSWRYRADADVYECSCGCVLTLGCSVLEAPLAMKDPFGRCPIGRVSDRV